MMLSALADALSAFSVVVLAYFVLWNGSQIALGLISRAFIRHYFHARTWRNLALSGRVASPPLVSVIVPAFNEAVTIVQSVRALLALDYEPLEIVVVNDGSSDDTLMVLQREFRLIPAPVAFVQPLLHAQLRGHYRSGMEPALVVIDKHNGGCKADAINAGINVASGLLVLTIDADTVIDPDALRRAVLPFLEDPTTIAVGGTVAIANGCRLKDGRFVEIALPDSWLARFQVVEYMRSFLLGRVASARLNTSMILSGAFGLFRRDAVIAVNGFDRQAMGEDMDLTVRLQQHYRAARRPFRIVFDPVPLCWTQVPEDWASLRSQRIRWRRGLLQVLWRHRRMCGNPRYGLVGMAVFPYVVLFEGLGPLIEIAGYVLTTLAAIAGFLNWQYYWLLLGVSLLFGVAATLIAVFLSDLATGRYLHGRDLVSLVAVAILENVGYRQLNSWWSFVGTVRMLTKSDGWGVIKRRVFEPEKTHL